MSEVRRRRFDNEFKLEVVRLVEEEGRPVDAELRRLKRELKDVEQERDILKKALAIFSKEPKLSIDLFQGELI